MQLIIGYISKVDFDLSPLFITTNYSNLSWKEEAVEIEKEPGIINIFERKKGNF